MLLSFLLTRTVGATHKSHFVSAIFKFPCFITTSETACNFYVNLCAPTVDITPFLLSFHISHLLSELQQLIYYPWKAAMFSTQLLSSSSTLVITRAFDDILWIQKPHLVLSFLVRSSLHYMCVISCPVLGPMLWSEITPLLVPTPIPNKNQWSWAQIDQKLDQIKSHPPHWPHPHGCTSVLHLPYVRCYQFKFQNTNADSRHLYRGNYSHQGDSAPVIFSGG